jgi:hypothetical protein
MKKKEEEYELLPYGEINKLREEISQLKKRKKPETHNSKEDVKELSRSINKLINIFEVATQFVKDDENSKHKEQDIYKEINQLNSHLTKILEENSLIAQVIIKLNDSVTDLQAMFSEFDKRLKTILKKTYLKVQNDTYVPKFNNSQNDKPTLINNSPKDKATLLKQYKEEFSK